MKTSYQLAMERLTKAAPAAKLSAQQKEQLAELDSKYTAKIAEREIALKNEMSGESDPEKIAGLQRQLLAEKKKLQAELEERKDRIRQS